MAAVRRPVVALFCGSRNWTDREMILRDLEALPDDSIVIEGGARGADTIAGKAAFEMGFHVATVPALWDSFGRAAGYRRNEAMLLLRPDVVYAYPLAGPGTRDMIERARSAGIPVVVRTPA
jgi:YspA, cpYpsA-related SLOG family